MNGNASQDSELNLQCSTGFNVLPPAVLPNPFAGGFGTGGSDVEGPFELAEDDNGTKVTNMWIFYGRTLVGNSDGVVVSIPPDGTGYIWAKLSYDPKTGGVTLTAEAGDTRPVNSALDTYRVLYVTKDGAVSADLRWCPSVMALD